MRFWIHFVCVAFTSTKDTASPYIFKRIFVYMPIHLLVFFLLCITSILFYRGGGGGQGPICLFKRSLKIYIFSRERGPFAKKWQLHLIWHILYHLNNMIFHII